MDQPEEKFAEMANQRRQQNDEAVMKVLKEIFKKDPDHLIKEDKDYICARFSYLTVEQRKTYYKVYEEKQKEVKAAEKAE